MIIINKYKKQLNTTEKSNRIHLSPQRTITYTAISAIHSVEMP